MNTKIKSSKTLITAESTKDNLNLIAELVLESDKSISNLNANITLKSDDDTENTEESKVIAYINRSKQDGNYVNFNMQCSEEYNAVATEFFTEFYEEINELIIK